MLDVKTVLPEIIAAVEQAGNAILQHFGADSVVTEKKADNSLVTAADREAHEIIYNALSGIDSSIPVLSEEGDIPDASARKSWQRFWLVDPLDGTKEFLAKREHFSINIALIEDGLPDLGLLYLPTSKSLFFATQADGAFEQLDDLTLRQLTLKPFDGVRPEFLVSSQHAGKEPALINKLYPEAKLTAFGSAKKFCTFAQGRADAYLRLRPTYEWDTAAGQAIVEAAGGQVLTFDGKPLSYNKTSLENPGFLVFGDQDWKWRELLQQAAESSAE